jgi:serine O-acetyltransferase
MSVDNLYNDRFGLNELVTELRNLRLQSLESRQRRDHPPKLPSKKILAQLVENIGSVLFPNRLGKPELTDEGLDYYVGHTLDNVLRQLNRQIALELRFVAAQSGVHDQIDSRAVEITRDFARSLPKIRKLLDSDIQAAYEGDPAAGSPDEVLACYAGVTAVLHYRIAHELHKLGARLVARIITEIAHSATGIDIHPGAEIDESFFIDHGTGVVIGETAIIGRNVRLYQAVTLGAKSFDKDENGMLVKGNLRHPIVEEDTVIYAGATILGRITIGRGSTIGGNVWLTHSVPPGSRITQGLLRRDALTDGEGV